LQNRITICKYGAPKSDGRCPFKEFLEMYNNTMLLGNCGNRPLKLFDWR
jgi:hypothetical protein